MTKSVEFWFDFGSPTAYLAWLQLPKIAAARNAEIVWCPMLLGGVHKATGNTPPGAVAAKGAYMGVDLARFAKRYGVTLNFNPHFPVNTLPLMRGAVAALHEGDDFFHRYVKTMYEAMWLAPRNLNEPAQIAAVLQEGGFDTDWFLARTSDQAIKDELIARTERAVSKGAFGAPTFYVGDQMFFGQDRLDFVDAALAE
ncbi:2-hydroxychromene-2-carboxylate isomerase [Pyruvatibacter sp.]|uniref:2-hydroxychromene-2-carboxylate isomerase n=1 Tax=Pyruvatibacter sp. TaxID=1981328 RepID=UPI0032EAA4BC